MIFPKPHKEEYYDSKYKVKFYDGDTDLMTLFSKIKNGNEDVTIKSDMSFSVDRYTLEISPDGITITASGDCGVFRAAASLKQLLKAHEGFVPCCRVEDWPEFEKRSYLFDISCKRMLKVETFKKLIDYLSELKYNEFQIYLEGRCFDYKEFAKYTADFDCLGANDMEELDRYCRERFIDLIPNQNSFGHLLEWLDQDEFKHLRVGNDEINTGTINPLLDESFEFIDKLCESLLPHFSAEYVNIGLDEAVGLGEYQLEEICKEKGSANVFMDWLNKLSSHIGEKYGKKVQFWADMVYNYPESFDRIPDGAIALVWGYDLIKSALMERICYEFKEHNKPFYVCPGNSTWLGTTGRFDVMSFNLRTAGEVGRKYGAKGYMLTDWGCGEGHHHFPVWSLIPAALASQYSWNVGVEQNGGWLKADYIRAAKSYVDNRFFGGVGVSEWIYKLQQYYHLEPERVHSGTLCCYSLLKPMTETAYPPFFDLDECGEPFYFENVLYYVNRCIEGVELLDFDENFKRQILVNANTVILGAEICLAKMARSVSKEKYDYLCRLIDEISAEFDILWERENFTEGKEIFLDIIANRKEELKSFVK